jgi:hypothetical protein
MVDWDTMEIELPASAQVAPQHEAALLAQEGTGFV